MNIKRWLDAILIPASLVAIFCVYPRDWASFNLYFALGLIGMAIFQGTGLTTSLYVEQMERSIKKEIKKLLCIWGASIGVLLLLAYMTKTSSQFSRIGVISWLISVPLFLISYRLLLRKFLNSYTTSNPKRVAIIGLSRNSRRLIRCFSEYPHLGMNVSAVYSSDTSREGRTFYWERGLPVSSLKAIKDDLEMGLFDRVFICKNLFRDSIVEELIKDLSDSTVDLFLVPTLECYDLHHARYGDVMGIPVVGLFNCGVDDIGGLLKRFFDVTLSAVILGICAIPMAVIAAAIKLTMPRGPILFKQRRYGIDGNEIVVWKFRSMTVCEDSDTTTKQATRDDGRITPLGNFIRKTSLDELPQFFNVIQGRMSIVGPRPHAVVHNELYRKAIPGYMLRHKVKPGVTGLAQVRGYRGETKSVEKMQRRVEADIEYVRSWSILLDVKVIIKTIFVGFVHKNAR